MIRYLRNRVVGDSEDQLSSPSGLYNDETHELTEGTGERNRTASRTPTSPSPLPPQSSSSSSPPPRGSNRFLLAPVSSKQKKSYTSLKNLIERQRQLNESLICKKVEELENFDACVEACDAFAASSTFASSASSRIDSRTGLSDCSLLVSPDGEVILLPSQHHATSNDNKSVVSRQKSALFDELGAVSHYDYRSAIYVGSDLQPYGDKALNGFSAKGWSIPSISLSLKQTELSLLHLEGYCENIIQAKVDELKKIQLSCEDFKKNIACDGNGIKYTSREKRYLQPQSWELDDTFLNKTNPRNNEEFEITKDRVGPLLYPQSSIFKTLKALEEYYETNARKDSERWHALTKTQKLTKKQKQKQKISASSDQHNEEGPVPQLLTSAVQTGNRASNRQKALQEMQSRVQKMEKHLQACQTEATKKWDSVYKAEGEVNRIMAEKMFDRYQKREQVRLEREQEIEKEILQKSSDEAEKSPSEIWDIISDFTENLEDGSFEPMELRPPSAVGAFDNNRQQTSAGQDLTAVVRSEPMVERADIEQDMGLPDLRSLALAAETTVEDASGLLLNVLANLDTCKRSARIAAETTLVAACNSQQVCIKSVIKAERESLNEKLESLAKLEELADSIDVREDLNRYIKWDRKQPYGSTYSGEDDDGGVASALAVLSSHVDGSMGVTTTTSHIASTTEVEDCNALPYDMEDLSREKIQSLVDNVFEDNAFLKSDTVAGNAKEAKIVLESAVNILCTIASQKSPLLRSHQSMICYAINAKRSSNAEIKTRIQFDGLCKVFDALLSGCDCESGSVSFAKMSMMLAQTFYIVKSDNTAGDGNDDDLGNQNANSDDDDQNSMTTTPKISPTVNERVKRIYAKNALMEHQLWSNENFWEQTLSQCISESLTHSGVMANFEMSNNNGRSNNGNHFDNSITGDENSATISKNDQLKQKGQSEWMETRKIKWYDLSPADRMEAAQQVHAVIFAQLGALAHSMIEFGCGLEKSCAFVRRMSIRNQLPASQRVVLLQHLIDRKSKSEQHDNNSENCKEKNDQNDDAEKKDQKDDAEIKNQKDDTEKKNQNEDAEKKNQNNVAEK